MSEPTKLGNVTPGIEDEELQEFVESRAPRMNVDLSTLDHIQVTENGEVYAHTKPAKFKVEREDRDEK